MAEQHREAAERTFATLCAALDGQHWNYRRDDDNLKVEYTVSGDDLPMSYTFGVDADHTLVRLESPLPMTVKEEKCLEVAVAVSMINDKLVNGCFDFNMMSGTVTFRICNSFYDSTLGAEVFLYMLAVSIHTVDQFNDTLFSLATGGITMEKFIETLNKITS